MGKFAEARRHIGRLRDAAAKHGLLGPRGEILRVPVKRNAPLPPEAMIHFWHPERIGVTPAPAAFDRMLKAIDPGLYACRAPSAAPIPTGPRWVIWVRNPRIQFWACTGWQCIFIWAHPVTGEELPLNELVFHNLHAVDRHRFGRAREYFDRIMSDIAKQKAAREKDFTDDRQDRQRDFIQSKRIGSHRSGSQFARHHDGTIVPSQGHEAMMAETQKWRLPDEVRRRMADDREKREYGR